MNRKLAVRIAPNNSNKIITLCGAINKIHSPYYI